ncbi:kinase-like domain-containing protein [Gigaspora rosea]|uniref:Kinase-like domain-containing protein n=1 Tax=Gigaspora rosea TaxID=44941 RepID=A0A397W334_9GLOM|nr:kinase-like domain-containing protein [Gigaspora rosea]
MLVFDKFYSERKLRYGKCKNCDRYNTSLDWCETCGLWTSGNTNIDNCIKRYEDIIEWVPFHRLDGIKIIGKGGFGKVFSATWLDGRRNYTSQRASLIVALKTLPGSQNNFLREFENYMKFRSVCIELEVYGLTRNLKKEYLMVFQYANVGNLRNYLTSHFKELNWKSKLKLLMEISEDLAKIHKVSYVHVDFHSGNILLCQSLDGGIIPYIADLGLSRKKEESDSEGIYGVLPYVAPEVLNKEMYTSAADIYSFGVIMAELSTGKPPHYDMDYNEELAIKICNGLRPEFSKDIPECYIQLANQCMDNNPSNRSIASDVNNKLNFLYMIVRSKYAKMFENGPVIKEAFEYANRIIPTLPTNIPNYSQSKLTSKLLNFQNLSNLLNSSFILHAQSSRIFGK